QPPPNLRRSVPGSGSYKFVSLRDCTLEAMRTQGAFSFFQGVAARQKDFFPSRLLGFCQIDHDVPVETNEFVERFFQNSLLIAVRAETFRPVFAVGHRAYSVTFNA